MGANKPAKNHPWRSKMPKLETPTQATEPKDKPKVDKNERKK